MSGGAEDLTPKFPSELLPIIKWLIEQVNTLGSFPEIMQGKGESGVRAGAHAETLMKTASPTLRDRALLTERQCAVCADLTADDDGGQGGSEILGRPRKDGGQLHDHRFAGGLAHHGGQPLVDADLLGRRAAADLRARQDGRRRRRSISIDNSSVPDKEAAKAAFIEHKKSGQTMQEKLFGQLSPEGKDKAIEKMLGGKHH